MVTASNRVYKVSYEASADPLIDCSPFLPSELANLYPAHPLHRQQPSPPLTPIAPAASLAAAHLAPAQSRPDA
jgi:hypothetical protein